MATIWAPGRVSISTPFWVPVSVSAPNRLTTGPLAGLVSLARLFGKLRKSAGLSWRVGAGGREATWVSPPVSGSAADAVTVGASFSVSSRRLIKSCRFFAWSARRCSRCLLASVSFMVDFCCFAFLATKPERRWFSPASSASAAVRSSRRKAISWRSDLMSLSSLCSARARAFNTGVTTERSRAERAMSIGGWSENNRAWRGMVDRRCNATNVAERSARPRLRAAAFSASVSPRVASVFSISETSFSRFCTLAAAVIRAACRSATSLPRLAAFFSSASACLRPASSSCCTPSSSPVSWALAAKVAPSSISAESACRQTIRITRRDPCVVHRPGPASDR